MTISPPHPALDFTDAENTMFGDLRQIQQLIIYFQAKLDELKQTSVLLGKNQITPAILTNFFQKTTLREFDRTDSIIRNHLSFFDQLAMINSKLYNYNADDFIKISSRWLFVSEDLWPLLVQSAKTPEKVEFTALLDQISIPLREIILVIGYVTIYPRVKEHLIALKPGQVFDFNANFRDEVPNDEDRTKVLRYIADHPDIIAGMVDVDKGIIYAAARTAGRQWWSVVRIILTVIVGVVVILALSYIPDFFNKNNWQDLLIGYTAVLAGGIFHLGVDVLKQSKDTKNQNTFVFDNLLLWINIKEFSYIKAVISLTAGLIGLAVVRTERIDFQTAFFVGYSIDSIIDIFLQRFTTTASKATESLTKQLSGETPKK